MIPSSHSGRRRRGRVAIGLALLSGPASIWASLGYDDPFLGAIIAVAGLGLAVYGGVKAQ